MRASSSDGDRLPRFQTREIGLELSRRPSSKGLSCQTSVVVGPGEAEFETSLSEASPFFNCPCYHPFITSSARLLIIASSHAFSTTLFIIAYVMQYLQNPPPDFGGRHQNQEERPVLGTHFPMQNLLNTRSSRSSVYTIPASSPNCCRAHCAASSASSSGGSWSNHQGMGPPQMLQARRRMLPAAAQARRQRRLASPPGLFRQRLPQRLQPGSRHAHSSAANLEEPRRGRIAWRRAGQGGMAHVAEHFVVIRLAAGDDADEHQIGGAGLFATQRSGRSPPDPSTSARRPGVSIRSMSVPSRCRRWTR